jgi:hypothetical protein
MSADIRKAFSHAEELTKFHPETLAAFLGQYPEYLSARGITLPDHATAETMPWGRLPDLFMRVVEGETPPDLIQDIVLIAELGKPSGHDKLKAELAHRDVVVAEIKGRTLHDFAMRVCLLNRRLLESAHSRVILQRQRAFDYYPPAQGITEVDLLSPKDANYRALEKTLAVWFHGGDMGKSATVIPYDFGHEIWFLVRHGSKTEMFSDMKDDGRIDIHFIRQLQYDVIVFNRKYCELKVKAAPKLHPSYKYHFGLLLTGDSTFFGDREVFNLERLRHFGHRHAPWQTTPGAVCDGLREIEYSIRMAADRIDGRRCRSCLTRTLLPGELLVPDYAERVEHAIFGISFGDAGKPRPVRVSAGRRANYCRDSDSTALEDLLRANGFMMSKEIIRRAAAA